jgi:CubicO group peptidase (beta-lactamase class C family)
MRKKACGLAAVRFLFRCQGVSLVGLTTACLLAGPVLALATEASLSSSPAKTCISAEEILRKALVARGGEAAAKRIKSFHGKGTVDFACAFRGSFECFAARPNESGEIFDCGGEEVFKFGFDGRTGWEFLAHKSPKTLEGERLRESQDDAVFPAADDEAASYRHLEYSGETVFEGAPCHQLEVITLSGRPQTRYYNATNNLPAGIVESITTEIGPTRRRLIFLEYRKVGGFLFPVRYRCRIDANEWVIRLTSVAVNEVDGSVFKMPSAPAPPPADSLGAQPRAPLTDEEIRTQLRDCIDGDKLGVGLVVGMVDSNQTRIVSYGSMDDAKSPEVNGDTLFEIGSITKVFTRLLLHDMVARGEMSLDDPVQKYLPAGVRMPTRHGKQITLWDLSTHTSGLPRDLEGLHTPEHLYTFLKRHKLRRDPADQFEYSNLGVALLAHVIALKAGTNYETLVRERICGPLQMDSTVVTLTPELQARRATGHCPPDRRTDFIGLQELPGAGALFSTANDMLKFASARLGLTPCPLTPLMKTTDGGHNGGTFGFSTMLAFDPEHGRALIVLSNCRGDPFDPQFRPLLENQSAKPARTVPVSAELCDQLTGQYYVKEGGVRSVRRQGTRLLLQELGKSSCELFALSETNFCNPMYNCQASFIRDKETGRATQLIVGGWRGIRVPSQVLYPSAGPLAESDCRRRTDSDLQGVWSATLRPWYWPFYALRAKIRIAEPCPGSFRGELDSPQLGVQNLDLLVIYRRPELELSSPSAEGSFTGKLNAAHTKVAGVWKQSGHAVRVTLKRVPQGPG